MSHYKHIKGLIMREWACAFQSTLLETRLNIFVSRCECSECPSHLSVADKETCSKCSYKVVPDGIDQWAGSITDIVQEVEERSDQIVEHIFTTHCKKCDQYNKETQMCLDPTCDCMLPVKELIKSTSVNCPLRLW